MRNSKIEFVGEFLGTFVLVLFGCGAVAQSVLLGTIQSLPEIAVIWGIAVALAVFVSRNMSPAHLNPAVSIAMCVAGIFPYRKLGIYVLAQMLGAFVAAACVYFVFSDDILRFELENSIVRGSPESSLSAMMFGEFYPNPAFKGIIAISTLKAIFIEAFGTFLLVYVIFKLTERAEQINNITPFAIGLTVSLIIVLIAPYTQACLNPARDFGPRLFSYFAGWGNMVFKLPDLGFITVYFLGPICGGVMAALVFRLTRSNV